MSKKQPTLNDVAALAGVSYQTVSRVINGSNSVSEKTKKNVYSAMEALNYIPNRVAQQLAGKKSCVLGLATIDIALHAPSQIASSIKKCAENLGYNVIISMIRNQSINDIDHVVNELIAQRVDGIIINIPSDHDQIVRIINLCKHTPVLFMDVDPREDCFSVMTDSREGGQKAISYLLGLGHTKIALVTGPKTSISARLRYEGWVKSLQKQNLTPATVEEGDWSSASGYYLVKKIYHFHRQFSAICFANDQMALGGLRALHELKIQVPQQMSVIGYDDTEDSAFFYPPLTTIAQDFKWLGEQAVKNLIDKIKNSGKNVGSVTLSAQLIERETTTAFCSTQSF